MNRRHFLARAGTAAAVIAVPGLATSAFAHHGWGWAEDEEFDVTGTITDVRLGNPHGELTLDVDGETWVIEIGQPWRNERAGLTAEILVPGTSVTAHGHRAKDPARRVVKAERLVIAGRDHVLYPDRAS